MSALGQKQTYALQQPVSALPPIATAKTDMPQLVMSASPPESRHVRCNEQCPLWAKSGHASSHRASVIASWRAVAVTSCGAPMAAAYSNLLPLSAVDFGIRAVMNCFAQHFPRTIVGKDLYILLIGVVLPIIVVLFIFGKSWIEQ